MIYNITMQTARWCFRQRQDSWFDPELRFPLCLPYVHAVRGIRYTKLLNV